MKNKLFISVFLLFVGTALYAKPAFENLSNDNQPEKQMFSCHNITSHTKTLGFSNPISANREADAALQYLLNEVAVDSTLSKEEQERKVKEFQTFAVGLSPEVAAPLIHSLLEETHSRVTTLLQNAKIDDSELNIRLSEYHNAVASVQNMTVEIARQMLFFVAELSIHRQYVYEFGVALECPVTQLLRHDLSKLKVEQFEGYARFLRGGKQEADKPAFLKAWKHHQYEEHHLEHYNKEGFSLVRVSDEYLRNNMRETVADLLAATKQRGGSTMIDWLINTLPKKNPHPLPLPFLKEALIKAHSLYLKAEGDSESDSIFKGLPCWNDEVEEVFKRLAAPPMDPNCYPN